jgi:hypothetical protein
MDNQGQSQMKTSSESDTLGKEYDDAVEKAENNDPEGFLKLYKIVSEGRSAELSDIGRDQLLHLLYSKTGLWITVFSRTDLEKLKSYLKKGGLVILQLPQGVYSEKQFDEEIVGKLSKIKGNEKEMELVNYILDLYKAYKKNNK